MPLGLYPTSQPVNSLACLITPHQRCFTAPLLNLPPSPIPRRVPPVSSSSSSSRGLPGSRVPCLRARGLSTQLHVYTQEATDVQYGDGDSVDWGGPAYHATLRMLDWPELCSHLADFASTHVGKRECLNLQVPTDDSESRRLLAETK